MKNKQHRLLITGGAGFIGSHVVSLFAKKYPEYHIFNLDSLTYCGNLENCKSVEPLKNYTFLKADIRDRNKMISIFETHDITAVIHLAAESHVDRSITDPLAFLETNVMGTVNLLEAAKAHWTDPEKEYRFYHVSTDEVFGSLGKDGFFTETTSYDPQSPYSASKASSDHFVRAYGNTYNLPYVLSNCSNNYGPNQFPEKLIPLFINNIKHNKSLPVYGDGKYTRDWLYVVDHAKAIDLIFHQARNGKEYNIGGWNEWTNIDLIKVVCSTMDEALGREKGTSEQLITYVKDRPGHDRRYAIDASKLEDELGWKPEFQFEQGIKETVAWYLKNQEWMDRITSGEYQQYYTNQYQQ